mmetsp:Transcript_20922/g.24072  ORF Transcript_20922/g.24072 Transcript_20922/m.24072 type:complete len:1020 (+) Transcript_20922:338-3397(+)
MSLMIAISSSRTAAFGSPLSKALPINSNRLYCHHQKQCFRAAAALFPLESDRRRKRTQLTKTGPSFGLSSSTLWKTRGGAFSTTPTTSSSTLLKSTTVEETISTTTDEPIEVFRKDYTPLPYHVTEITMNFDINDGCTTVTSELFIQPNPKAAGLDIDNTDFCLDGEEDAISLLELKMNGRSLIKGIDYVLTPSQLILKPSALKLPTSSESDDTMLCLQTVVQIKPEENTQLSGLYKSGSMYCSQCEAMGFRRITYYPDKPENMAIFSKIRIEADEESYPVLLSNGNLVESGKVNTSSSSKRHYSIWTDPFPKPSYLFALVAGKLGSISDTYTTSPSNQKVHLEIYSEPENVHKLSHAMTSLKNSMKWDEDIFGLEYDLGVYNIVAVNDFNMGAMENKGLNVFNTAYVLADPKTATDGDYEQVEAVIGHEYFHNWTGNRVTCRDWFQLTLKEGLTVFRDQEFSADMMGSKDVKRIEDVRTLRAGQFSEDAGPMSHPIRPESYISMDNFYTATVYSKGAEVIRMYHTLLKPEGFRKGMDLYFQRHDGSGVTCNDFRAAMADANNVDLSQFGRWYETPGTPTVTYSHDYNSEKKMFSLTLTQGSLSLAPLHIPIAMGLIDAATGNEVVSTTVLELTEQTQTFYFENVDGPVVPSILRQFSAPVKLLPESGTVDEEALAFLAANDTDGFNRWEAGQKLFSMLCFQTMNGNNDTKTRAHVYDAFERTLLNYEMNNAMKAYALSLPTESTLAEELDIVDPLSLANARGSVRKDIARRFQSKLMDLYEKLTSEMNESSNTGSHNGGVDDGFKVDAESIGKRRLRNILLSYLTSIRETPAEQRTAAELATAHYESARGGMTDKMAALTALASMHGEETVESARDQALQLFYDEANGDALVINKWFAVQASADLPDVLNRIKNLTKHPDFTLSNPNRCRSLIGTFASSNMKHFHAINGEGYEFVAETIAELDGLNPQISSRIGKTLIQWRKYNEELGTLMKMQLTKLMSGPQKLSDDLFEVVSTGLK